jgi:hypothetical protein
LVAIAVLLVIGVTIGATLLFTRDGDGPSTPPTSDVPSDIASANDTGPVEIITEEPTCEAYRGINNALAGVQSNGWSDERDRLGPNSEWTPTQREQVNSIATAMRNASEKVVPLAKQTPHRVVRELYEQFIAYGRAYAESVPSYTPPDNYLASVNVSVGSALMTMCDAIAYGATNRALTIAPAQPPTDVAPPGDPGNPTRFLATSSDACSEWLELDVSFRARTSEWQAMDSGLTSTQWTAEQRRIQMAALPEISGLAGRVSELGRQSGNAILEDFAETASLYLRAYVTSGDSYVAADSYLTATAFRLRNTVSAACQSASV